MRPLERPRGSTAGTRAAASAARGVVRVPDRGHFHHERLVPRPELAPYVAHFWHVSWDLPDAAEVETLPHPCVHLVFSRSDDATSAEVVGVSRRRFTQTLAGRGWVFGIKFRPATFRGLYDVPAITLTDRTFAFEGLLPAAASLTTEVLAATALVDRIAVAEAWLLTELRRLDVTASVLRDLVELAASDTSLLRSEDLAKRGGFDSRSLQRHFRDFVGVSPKWVICRYRLHEAAQRMMDAPGQRLSRLASDLGYADQAHFTRDFKATLGCTPRQFLERQR